MHQEILRGKVSQLLAQIKNSPLRGELVVFIAPQPELQPEPPQDWGRAVEELCGGGMEKKEAIKHLAVKYAMPKREIYDKLIKR